MRQFSVSCSDLIKEKEFLSSLDTNHPIIRALLDQGKKLGEEINTSMSVITAKQNQS